jgi:hypothetical protein
LKSTWVGCFSRKYLFIRRIQVSLFFTCTFREKSEWVEKSSREGMAALGTATWTTPRLPSVSWPNGWLRNSRLKRVRE